MKNLSNAVPKEPDGPDVPMPLAVKDSRLAIALIMGFFALFWNGISWSLAIGFLWNDFSIFPFLFIGLFCVIGLAFLALAVSLVLQLFNPVPQLICSQTLIYPGSEFELSWVQKGKSSSIKKMTVTLEGMEEVTYRQGTSNRTERSVFYRDVVIETVDPPRLRKVTAFLVCLAM